MSDPFPIDAWASQIPKLKQPLLAGLPDKEDLIMFLRRGNYSTYQGPEKSYVVRYEGTWPKIKAKRLYVCLYIPDHILEAVWTNLAGWTKQVQAYNPYAVCGVSFSLWYDDPLPIQVYNLWRIRFVERYLQDNGIRVVPTLMSTPALKGIFHVGVPIDLPAAFFGPQMMLKRGSGLDDMQFSSFLVQVRRAFNIDAALFYGAQTRASRLACLRVAASKRALFLSWGHEYRQYIAKKSRNLLPSAPTQRYI